MARGVVEAEKQHDDQHHRRVIDNSNPDPHLDLSVSVPSSNDDDNGCTRKNCFMLVDLIDGSGYLLYKIDLLHHLLHNDDDNLSSLCPLLFFPSIKNYEEFFNCIKLGSKFYFFGLDLCALGGFVDDYDDESYTNVYTLEEEDLMCIEPSEHNNVNNFRHLFTKIDDPMHSPKRYPTLFIANQKLYVISHVESFENSSFEVFSPSDQTWQVLPTPPCPKGRNLDLALLVLEQEQTVFFCDSPFAFNLQTNSWTPTAHSIYYSDSDDDTISRPLVFKSNRVSLIGDMAFGFIFNAQGYYVCASRATTPTKELMQPNLAPDQAFLEVFSSSRFTYMDNKIHDDLYSDYIVALQDMDGKQVLCIVTYGTNLASYHAKTSNVALTFFDIPGDFYTSKVTNLYSSDAYADDYAYADDTAEDGSVARSYFNAKFRHTSHFVVTNSHLPTHGQIEVDFENGLHK